MRNLLSAATVPTKHRAVGLSSVLSTSQVTNYILLTKQIIWTLEGAVTVAVSTLVSENTNPSNGFFHNCRNPKSQERRI